MEKFLLSESVTEGVCELFSYIGIVDESQLDVYIRRLTTVDGYVPDSDYLDNPEQKCFKLVLIDKNGQTTTYSIWATRIKELKDISSIFGPSIHERGNYKKLRNGEYIKIE